MLTEGMQSKESDDEGCCSGRHVHRPRSQIAKEPSLNRHSYRVKQISPNSGTIIIIFYTSGKRSKLQNVYVCEWK